MAIKLNETKHFNYIILNKDANTQVVQLSTQINDNGNLNLSIYITDKEKYELDKDNAIQEIIEYLNTIGTKMKENGFNYVIESKRVD